MSLSWEHHWRHICQGKEGLTSTLARGLLWTLSNGYRSAISLRNIGYNQGFLPSNRPENCLIISVGNLVAGGTGKTPIVIKLAEELSLHAKVAILSRGYKSKAEHAESTLIHPGDYGGDEPTMIANRLPNVLVFVGKNRRQSAQMATEAGAEIILLDDGLQHRQLARDLEIIVIDGTDPFGCGYYLPRGFLRDSPRTLKRADLVIVNQPTRSVDWLRAFTSAPVVGVEMKPNGCHGLNGGAFSLEGKNVGLFCGIAKPEKFRQTMLNLGATVVTEHFFPDHARLSADAIRTFADYSRAQGAELLVCTEKDHIKLHPTLSTSLPIAWLQIDAEIVLNQDIWQRFLEPFCHNCHNPRAVLPSF